MLKCVLIQVLKMFQARRWLRLFSYSLVVPILSTTLNATSAYSISLSNSLSINGETTDLYPFNGSSANVNRLGGFFSDLYYDRQNNVYYGLADRGPGGGVISYETRVQKFSLDVDQNTGAISNFNLLDTIQFTKGAENYNGLNPKLLNGDAGTLGLSFDPEGFAVASNGNFYVADEYGPSVYEFGANGAFIRAFATPNNLVPQAGSSVNYVDGRPIITSGRQDNRGFEGLTVNPDGTKLFAIMQDPLVNEGSPDGRRSPNLRLVEFDTTTAESVAQYIYTLDSLADISEQIPGTENDFGSNSQGRNIGVSAITALNENEFLVLERDNRGLGVEDATGSLPIGSKRVYKIDLTEATDVSDVSLANTNTLPSGVTAVSKSLFLDIAATLQDAGQMVPEKLEGIAVGPQLADGSYAVLIGTDNDFSVTQTGSGTQLDVCTNGIQVDIDTGCPTGSTLIPTYLYSLKVSSAELEGFVPQAEVPEPSATTGVILLGLGGWWLKRRQS
jgi:hypothetical protein